MEEGVSGEYAKKQKKKLPTKGNALSNLPRVGKGIQTRFFSEAGAQHLAEEPLPFVTSRRADFQK